MLRSQNTATLTLRRLHRAVDEFGKYCKTNIAWNGKEGKFTDIAPVSEWNVSKESKYVVFCANETIQGVEFKDEPKLEGKTLIADVSSNFLSKPIDVKKYGVIYGGVQKNIGPAGMAILIVREDLLGAARCVKQISRAFKPLRTIRDSFSNSAGGRHNGT
jgi:phosphoserine aminotransferase